MGGHLFISAGETSGEQHAARLCNALRQRKPSLELSGMGGALLRAAGVDIVVDMSDRAVMGFLEVVKHLPFLRRAMETVLTHIEQTRPDAVILVDYPGFHLRLARAVKKRFPHIPVLYYIAPKVWAWNESRVNKIRASVDKLLCIFPFEEAYFEERRVPAEYVGNPSMDAVNEVAPDVERLYMDLGVGSYERLVTLLPGSRRKELERLWPLMLRAARRLRDFSDLTFAVAVAPGMERADLDVVETVPDWIRVVEGRTLEMMVASDLLLAKSGTTTLEAALLGVPMVVVYKTSWLSGAIAKRVLRIPHISLPNIVAERKIVPELLQEQANPERLAAESAMLLAIPERAERQKADFRQLRSILGEEPAATRTAAAVLDMLAP